MVKIGIIGSGFGLYGLLPAFNSTTGCKVVSICGEKTERLINYCQSISLKKIYTNWRTMLDEEKLDAIAIAVIPSAQYQIAKVAIGKNLHIFAEKPLAVTYAQAKELLNLATKKKIVHAVDFIFPEIEEWQKAKQIIDKKTLGKLKEVYLNWDFLSYDIKNKIPSWKTDVAQGGGALSFYFSHSLYYLEHYVGKVLNFRSVLSYSKESLNGREVGVDLILKFKNGVNGYAHLCCNVHGFARHQLIFVCKRGTIVLENVNGSNANFIIKIYTDKKTKQLSIPKENYIQKNEDERVRIVKKIAKRFINSVAHNKKFAPSFKEGVRVQELIEKIRANKLI